MYILFVLYSFVFVNGIEDMMTEVQCVALLWGLDPNSWIFEYVRSIGVPLEMLKLSKNCVHNICKIWY